MATRYGWTWGELPDDQFGDCPVVDPMTGKSHTPYEGKVIQEGEG